MKLHLLAAVLMLFFSLSTFADDVDEALAVYKKGDYSLAATLFTQLASKGEASAQYILGVMYDKGRGVNKSHELATKWYSKAAEQGHMSAQYNLGLNYEHGQGASKNDQLAVVWYRKAAEQGSSLAQYNLGSMYYNGLGISQSDQQAVVWYLKAAEQGHSSAQTNLALMYTKMQDHEKAFTWYLKAAQQDVAPAQFNLGVMYEKGYGIKQDAEMALYWFSRAFDGNFRSDKDWYTIKKAKLDEVIRKEKAEEERFNKARKQRENMEKERVAWSENIKPGDDTFCGPIIEVNGPMIKIAARALLPGYASEVWLKRSELYPPSVKCRNLNGNLQPIF